MENYRLRMLVAVLFLPLLLASCSFKQMLITTGIIGAGAAGAAAVYYTKGDLEVDQKAELDRVFKASQSALVSRGYDVKSKELNALNAKIDATRKNPDNNDEENVKIRLEKMESGDTHISIRIGTFGNEDESRELLEGIQERLS